MTAARIAFVVAGVAGMLMIVRPGADIFRGASLLALASAACYAVYQITTRMLAGEDPRVTLFYPALVGAVADDAWCGRGSARASTSRGSTSCCCCAIGVLGTVGHFLFILAFQRAPASALTPFTYVHLVFATLIGWLAVRRPARRAHVRRHGAHRRQRPAAHVARAAACAARAGGAHRRRLTCNHSFQGGAA